jgi:hypothetical protein
MVSPQSVDEQLKRLHFVAHAWNRAEIRELPNILMPDEEMYECTNGSYEGGLAVLIATNIRVLLIDKKFLNYLTVEDLRFDMINEIDYSHRLMGAYISISAGSKNLRFTSYNQPRLRKLINHVQHCIAESKKQQTTHQAGQNQHLEQINQQLQAYLVMQQKNQEELSERLKQAQAQGAQIAPPPAPTRPDPQLADYLFAQSLLKEHEISTQEEKTSSGGAVQEPDTNNSANPAEPIERTEPVQAAEPQVPMSDLYAEGMQEVFGKHEAKNVEPSTAESTANPLEVNALRIAYSKLPMALRNRKFGRPSFHAHSQAEIEAAKRITPLPTIS